MESKHIAKSLTLQGAVVMFLMLGMQWFDVEAEESQVMRVVEGLVILGGFAMTIIGRIRAKKALHVK